MKRSSRLRFALPCAVAAASPLMAQTQGIAGPVSIEHERFGAMVASVPDVNGDGVGDAAVVADDPWAGLESQRVFIYSGADGAYIRAIVGVFPAGSPQTFAVTDIAGLADVDGDSRGDLAIADAPGRRVLLISGGTGQLIRVINPPAGTDNRRFATSIGALDDVNADGRPDLIVGAPTAQLTFIDAGVAYVFSGATGALLRTVHPLPIGAPVQNGDPSFGARVIGTPDLNADGVPDAVVGSYESVSVVSGVNGAIIRRINGFPNAQGFGRAIAACPDANGDGVADLVIGAPLSGLSSPTGVRGLVAECGRAYLYSGATGALLRSWRGPLVAGTRFGWSIAGVSDLTGDGRGDVVIGAPVNPDAARGAGYGPGRVMVYNGSTGGLVTVVQSPNAELGGAFGLGVAAMPDTNANGRGEILIGGPQEDPNTSAASERGRAYIVRF